MDFGGNTSEQCDVLSQGSATVNSGATKDIYLSGTTAFDLRPYSSVYCEFTGQVIPASPTGYNEILYNFWGLGDPSTTVAMDMGGFWASGGGSYNRGNGGAYYSNTVRSPYALWQLTNAGADQCQVGWKIYGSTRVVSRREFRDFGSITLMPLNLIGFGITSGATTQFPISPASGGLQKVYLQNTGAGGATCVLRADGASGAKIKNLFVATATIAEFEMILPQNACLLSVSASGGNVTLDATITSES